jgi:hypothetical protein
MTKLLLSLVAIATLSLSSFGQAPEGFKYQAVVRDAGNLILNNQAVGMQLTIQQGSIGGTAVYTETFALTTNAYGLVNLEIGSGNTTDDFSTIDWGAGPYFIETAIDGTGGTTYVVMGTSQLMSVPYALYAKTSGNGQGPAGPQGIQGPAGIDGTNGTNGTNGIDGVDGATGLTGPAGADGTNGTNGTDGATGLTGPAGADGTNGTNGTDGATGLTGPAGADGTNGTNGTDGATGLTGPAGANGTNGTNGDNGDQGIQGLQGIAGTNGDTGVTGDQGAAGATGPAGADGTNGTNGTDGATGLTGPVGADGTNGTNGTDGATGLTGPVHTIGESYGGGIVFYVYDGGQHGLIAAIADQSRGIRWYGGTNTNTRARADGIGAGLKNTAIIIANQGPVDGAAFAATVCNEYSVTVGGTTYGDWYLPSKYELNLLYLQRNVVGGFASNASNGYWSSTEYNGFFAWVQYFNNGGRYIDDEYDFNYVRAVRAF